MDKLTRRLRDDADNIQVVVSDELDRRITASLHAVEPLPERAARPGPSASFWWASTIAGVAAAAALVAVINWRAPAPAPAETGQAVDLVAVVPDIDWKVESAMLTSPLQKELDDLQADLRKAEEKVKQDIGF
jgi:hypothetical protein